MPTLQDIAQAADVSPSTVSLVLNERGSIGGETRQRVKKVAREMGYQSRSSAGPPRNSVACSIGVIYATNVAANRGMSILARTWIGAIREVIGENGGNITLIAATDHVDKDHLFTQVLEHKEIQGAIFIGSEPEDGYVDSAVGAGVPTVVFDQWPKQHEFSTVTKDERTAGRQVAEHLLELGHRRIGIVTGEATDMSDIRLKEFRAVLSEHNVKPIITDGGDLFNKDMLGVMRNTCSSFLDQGITAIFANSDIYAVECLDALADLDISVPEAVSVIGFDDVAGKSRSGHIPTSVGFNKISMGEESAHILLRLMDQDDHAQALSAVFPTFIVDHGTTGLALDQKEGKQNSTNQTTASASFALEPQTASARRPLQFAHTNAPTGDSL